MAKLKRRGRPTEERVPGDQMSFVQATKDFDITVPGKHPWETFTGRTVTIPRGTLGISHGESEFRHGLIVEFDDGQKGYHCGRVDPSSVKLVRC